MFMRIVAGLLASSLAAAPALAQPRLVHALAPGSRAVEVDETATFFVAVLNSGDATATNCRLTATTANPGAAAFLASSTYYLVDESFDFVPGANPLFDLAAGGQQTLLLSLTALRESRGIAVQPLIACDNAASAASPAVNRIWLRTEADGAAPTDLITSIVTISGDGVMRTNRNGGRAVAAGAMVNVGGAGQVEFFVDYGAPFGGISDPSLAIDSAFESGGPAFDHDDHLRARPTICETDGSGACIGPITRSIWRTFAADEVFTFTVFLEDDGDGEIPFLPELTRLTAYGFEWDSPRSGIAGQASVAVTDGATGTLGPDGHSGVWYGYAGDTPGANGRNLFSLMLHPDGRVFMTSAQPGTPDQLAPSLGTASLTASGDDLRLTGALTEYTMDGDETFTLDGLVLGGNGRMRGAPTGFGGDRVRGYHVRENPFDGYEFTTIFTVETDYRGSNALRSPDGTQPGGITYRGRMINRTGPQRVFSFWAFRTIGGTQYECESEDAVITPDAGASTPLTPFNTIEVSFENCPTPLDILEGDYTGDLIITDGAIEPTTGEPVPLVMYAVLTKTGALPGFFAEGDRIAARFTACHPGTDRVVNGDTVGMSCLEP